MNKIVQSRVMTTICGLLVVLGSESRVVKADFVFGEPEKIPNVSRPGAGAPRISPDGLELYFLYSGENPCSEVWVATRLTTKEPWGVPVRVDFPAGSAKPIVDVPCLSADGLEMYFGEGYPGLIYNLKLPCTFHPGGYGKSDLWVSRRTAKGEPWGRPENLGPVVNTPNYEGHPSISADGLSLYFASERPGGYGFLDIYVTTRESTDDPWGPPVNLGVTINTATVGLPLTAPAESSPFISPDGLTLYYVVGDLRADIYLSTRATVDEPWGKPVAFGPVNDPLASEYFLSYATGDSHLYFFRAANMLDQSTYGAWQVEVLPIVDFNGDGRVDATDMAILADNWGQNGTLCDIGPFPRGDGVVDETDLAVLMESLMIPGPYASDVPCDVVLRWESPEFAESHDVYLGASFEAVNGASRDNPLNTLVSWGQLETTYTPETLLELNRTYYWRVDTVVGPSDSAIYRGRVLAFTTEAYGHRVRAVVATASSSQAGMGPGNTVDGSGLDNNDGHSTDGNAMWLSTNAKPHWIQFEFDRVYALQELWVWNSNQLIEPILGFGAKTVKVEYSVDGATWTTLDGVPEFARAPGEPAYKPNTTVGFGGASAKYVKLLIEANWGGVTQTGLAEVKFFYIPDRSSAQP